MYYCICTIVYSTHLVLGSLIRYSTDITILSPKSCVLGSSVAASRLVKPFTLATTAGFTTANSRKVSIHTLRMLSSLCVVIATSDRAKGTGKVYTYRRRYR